METTVAIIYNALRSKIMTQASNHAVDGNFPVITIKCILISKKEAGVALLKNKHHFMHTKWLFKLFKESS